MTESVSYLISKAFVEQPRHVFSDCSESTLVYDNERVNLDTIDLGGLVIMITPLYVDFSVCQTSLGSREQTLCSLLSPYLICFQTFVYLPDPKCQL